MRSTEVTLSDCHVQGPISHACSSVGGRVGVASSGAVPRTAVVIEPSGAPEIARLLLQAYGLSPRELEIAQMLLAGFSVPHIARLLMLSPYTARDHLKSIFQKVGVASQQELVAAVYFRHYVPELARGRAPGPAGWFG
jgi:DNA-binding CsgD family transcriptional regulator